jgi:hypothetical protein
MPVIVRFSGSLTRGGRPMSRDDEIQPGDIIRIALADADDEL